MSSGRPGMPVVVAGGGEAADTGDRPIDRQDRRIERNHSLTLRRSLSAGLALIVVIAAAGIAAWVGLFRYRRFTEPPCPSAVRGPPTTRLRWSVAGPASRTSAT